MYFHPVTMSVTSSADLLSRPTALYRLGLRSSHKLRTSFASRDSGGRVGYSSHQVGPTHDATADSLGDCAL